MNEAFRSGCDADILKKSPAVEPWTSMYSSMTAAGHRESQVLPSTTSAPTPNWSHFDHLRCTFTIVRLSRLSAASSPHMSEAAAETLALDSGSSLPSQKKPKKAVQHTAHTNDYVGGMTDANNPTPALALLQ